MGYSILVMCFIIVFYVVLRHYWDKIDELEIRNKYQAREIKILEEKANKYKWAAERYYEILKMVREK